MARGKEQSVSSAGEQKQVEAMHPNGERVTITGDADVWVSPNEAAEISGCTGANVRALYAQGKVRSRPCEDGGRTQVEVNLQDVLLYRAAHPKGWNRQNRGTLS